MPAKSLNEGGFQTFRPASWQTWKQRWPILVFIAVAAFAWWLFQQAGQSDELSGLLEAPLVHVSTVESGRVTAVMVVPGQEVVAGAVLVQLDTSEIDAEIAATTAALDDERIQRERQYATAIQRVSSELRDLHLRQAADTVEAEIYRAEYERQRRAFEQQLITVDSIASVKARAESLEKVIAIYPSAIADAEAELVMMQALQADNSSNADDSEAMRLRTAKLALLKQQRDNCTLRAAEAGTVVDVFVRPGSVLVSGLFAISMLTRDPVMIYGFIPETDPRNFQVGDIFQVSGAHAQSSITTATAVTLSPVVITIPDAASALPNRYLRGRTVRLRLESVPSDWVPGQSVLISPTASAWYDKLLSF